MTFELSKICEKVYRNDPITMCGDFNARLSSYAVICSVWLTTL